MQKVGLREINGYDEQLLAEIRDYPIPFKTSALLGRVIELVDDSNNSSAVEIARQLTAGDRIVFDIAQQKNDIRE